MSISGMSEGERGYSLLEVIVVVSILSVILAVAVPSFSQNPGAVTASIGMVRTAIDEASALAFANGVDTTQAGRGATIQFTTDSQTGDTVGRVYWGRPYSAALANSGNNQLQLEGNLAEIRTKTHIRIGVSGSLVDPPFAMFISPSGHASTMAGNHVTLVPNVSEIPCVGNFSIEFSSGTDIRMRQISCEYTTMLPDPKPSGATSDLSSTKQSP
jgi:prepilin-type N-terminal cleavage/methylation domain-containing protein